jgi:ABC-2 type transport system permease protein
MNAALWRKAIADAWKQLLLSSLLMVFFGWVFVWLQSLIKVGAWARILNLLPGFVEQMAGVPLGQLATQTGRLSILYVHFVPMFVCLGWAIGRGSDAVSGGIARGTLELVLTLPVRRAAVLFSEGLLTTAGAAIVTLALWVGNWLGLATFSVEGQVRAAQLFPGAVNLLCMTFCLAGITTLLSSWDHDRWRTMWLAGGFFVLSAILKMISRLWQAGEWLKYLSFLTAFEPQKLILQPDGWPQFARYNGSLLAAGLIAYLAAFLIFIRRDIPVPR